MSENNSENSYHYGNESGGVHYVKHNSHCRNGCYIIVGCSRFWLDGPQQCIICEGAKRDISLDLICEILDKHYLGKEVSDPKVLSPLVPEYIKSARRI